MLWKCSLLLIVWSGLLFAEPVPANQLQSVVYYLVHPGGPLSLRVQADYPEPKVEAEPVAQTVPTVLATIYDPAESATDLYWRDEAGERQKELNFALADAPAGIWQVRVTISSTVGLRHQLLCQPELPVALLVSRGWIRHRDTAWVDGKFFIVPADVSGELTVDVTNCQVTVLDLSGQTVGTCERGQARLPLVPGALYQLRLTTRSPNWHWVAFGGFPVIFAPTAELARTLAAGRVLTPDGEAVAHRFQAGIAAWKKKLRPEELVLPPINLQEFRDAFAAQPESLFLLSTYGGLGGAEFLLKAQNLDATSKDFGSTPYDPGVLAFLYTLNQPFNPYHRLAPLRKRLTLYYLNKLFRQKPIYENGTEEESSNDYSGPDAMRMVPDSIAFMLLSDDLSDEERQLWGDGLAFPLRRFFCDRVSCENQSSHWPVKLYAYARGSGRTLFAELAAHFIQDANNPQLDRFIRTGYLQEAYGLDATYQGLGASLIAFYYHFSRDPQAFELLRRIYTLLNHTVAPEPDGRILYGPSGFSHRTMGGWPKHQYGAGTRLLAAELPEAACWHQTPAAGYHAADAGRLLEQLANGELMSTWTARPYILYSYSFAPFAQIWYTCPPIKVRPDAQLPVQQEEAFTRNFNDEFYFFRRPGYYFGAYTGTSAGQHVFWNKHKAPYSCTWTENNGVFTSVERKIFMPLSGPQLFWTPAFGVALCSMNWNLYTLWTCRWEKGDELDWGSYWETTHSRHDDGNGVVLQQRFRGRDLHMQRDLTTGPQGVDVSLTPSGDIGAGQLIEQLPFPCKPGVVLQHQRGIAEWSDGVPAEPCQILRWFHRASGAGVQISFERPVMIKAGRTYADQGVTLSSLEAIVPAAGLRYRLEGCQSTVGTAAPGL